MRRWTLIAVAFASTAALAQVGPSEIWGLIYNLVAPTLSDKQVTDWQGSSSGQLKVSGISPAGCTGAIDLSEGCTLTVLLGLGP